jgi:ribonucleoside-diphosphate reductase alpha chain
MQPSSFATSRKHIQVSDTAEDSMEGKVGENRRKLATDRSGPTIKLEVGGAEGYITANGFEDGSLGEIFYHGFGKSGSTLEGWTQGFAAMTSIAIQFGAELPMLARKFAHMRFEPNGETNNTEIPWCASVIDFTFRWLAKKYGDDELNKELDKIADEMRQRKR